jgi:hypothetical protein
MTMDPLSAMLVTYWSQSTAQSALPDAPVVPEERRRVRAFPFGRRGRS